jgi:two-component system, chemotaxis family, protein-glutamate methylesterase/glutaminase
MPHPASLARPRYVIGIAASAGGVEALRTLIAGLPAGLDAAICVVLHIPSTGRSMLAPILDRSGDLQAVLAQHGAPLLPGTIYVAPADHHLLIRADAIELSRGPKENGVRPAADPMLRSLARAWGEVAIAVVLSGALDDGAAGAAAVVEAGGRLIVQAPDDALVPGMPSSAIAVTRPDAVLPLDEIAGELREFVARPAPDAGKEDTVDPQPDPAELGPVTTRPDGPASGFTCPECSGALWEVREGEVVRYRCRVGHAYSEEAMVDAQRDSVEAALWTALEVLEERGELLRRIADRMESRTERTQVRLRNGAREADERAAVIRRVLAAGVGSVDHELDGEREAAAG